MCDMQACYHGFCHKGGYPIQYEFTMPQKRRRERDEVAFLKYMVLTKPILYVQYMYVRVFVLCE